jgi:MT0933-like antitoxin protein
MSILDKFRRSASKAKEQADHVVDQHGDKIATGIEKTGEVASKVTGHRFDDKIDKGVNKAKERLEHHDEGAETPPGPASTSPSTSPEPPPPPPTAETAAAEEPAPEPDKDKGTGTGA